MLTWKPLCKLEGVSGVQMCKKRKGFQLLNCCLMKKLLLVKYSDLPASNKINEVEMSL